MSDKIYKQKIVTFGGGTGHFNLLNGLKKYNDTSLITAVVASWDSGGSSGRLRTELGVLPPGDIRRCVLALMEDPEQPDWIEFIEGKTGVLMRNANCLELRQIYYPPHYPICTLSVLQKKELISKVKLIWTIAVGDLISTPEIQLSGFTLTLEPMQTREF